MREGVYKEPARLGTACGTTLSLAGVLVADVAAAAVTAKSALQANLAKYFDHLYFPRYNMSNYGLRNSSTPVHDEMIMTTGVWLWQDWSHLWRAGGI